MASARESECCERQAAGEGLGRTIREKHTAGEGLGRPIREKQTAGEGLGRPTRHETGAGEGLGRPARDRVAPAHSTLPILLIYSIYSTCNMYSTYCVRCIYIYHVYSMQYMRRLKIHSLDPASASSFRHPRAAPTSAYAHPRAAPGGPPYSCDRVSHDHAHCCAPGSSTPAGSTHMDPVSGTCTLLLMTQDTLSPCPTLRMTPDPLPSLLHMLPCLIPSSARPLRMTPDL